MRLYSIIIFFALTVSACAPVYVPPVNHAPLLKEKNEFKGALHWSTAGLGFQAAYAPADNIGLKTSLSFRPGINEQRNRHIYGELAGGYFLPFSEHGVFEVYTGVGIGNAEGYAQWTIFQSTNTRNTRASYIRPFLQTNLGLTSNYVDFGLSNRFVYLNIYEFRMNNVYTQNAYNDIYIEPAIFMRLGYDPIKFSMQTGFSIPVTTVEDYSWVPWYASIGIHLALPVKNN